MYKKLYILCTVQYRRREICNIVCTVNITHIHGSCHVSSPVKNVPEPKQNNFSENSANCKYKRITMQNNGK